MKLQKQLSRKVGGKEYAKWVIILPPDKIEKTGWKEGEELEIKEKDGKLLLLRRVKNQR